MGILGERVGVFPALAFSGIVAVALAFAVLLAAKQSLRGIGDVLDQPVWLWTGGALSVLIILAILLAIASLIYDYIEAMVRANRYLPPPPVLAPQVFDVFDWPAPAVEPRPDGPACHEPLAVGSGLEV